MKPTDVSQFIGEIQAGVLEEQLSTIISKVACAVVAHSKAGEITLKLKFKQAGDTTDHVNIEHTISSKTPSKYGDKSENETRVTPMYVNEGNNVTLFPENQTDMFVSATKDAIRNAD